MQLGLQLGYWGQMPSPDWVDRSVAADELGFTSVWTAESWGSDALSPLAYLAAKTQRIKLGTAVMQLAARTPTATAMSAMTMDYLSDGRFRLGLGVSGPQVVEGWYGRPSDKPLARTREYVEIIRAVLRREAPLNYQGEFPSTPTRVPAVSAWASRSSRSSTRCVARSRSTWAPKARRTSRRQRRSPMDGCRCTTRRTARRSTQTSWSARRTTSRSPRSPRSS